MRKPPFLLLSCWWLATIGAVNMAVADTSDKIDDLSHRIEAYSLVGENDSAVWVMPPTNRRMSSSGTESLAGISLGHADRASPEGPGLSIMRTYDDWQYYWSHVRVDHNVSPSMHFTYGSLDYYTQTFRWGYNVYNPANGGDWPQGIGVGCKVQQSWDEGRWPNVGALPTGGYVIAGNDGVDGPYHHHMYEGYQAATCYLGLGSRIPRSQYAQGFVDTLNLLMDPQIAVQVLGTDTVIHVIAREKYYYNLHGIYESVIQHFRKVNEGPIWSGTVWEGPNTIDTVTNFGYLAASPVSARVAVVYLHGTSWAYELHRWYDQDVVYRESDSAGASGSWGEPINITNYDRSEKSYGLLMDQYALYDSEDQLHVIWDGQLWPANVYDSADFRFLDLNVSLFHWTTRTGQITRVANREYGSEYNPVIGVPDTRVCGGGGYGAAYLAFYTMGECNGRLYVVYAGWNDVFGTGITDDCASSPGTAHDNRWQANGDLYFHVSTTLNGLLWDAPRNITNTYTPGCDSAGFGGVCMDETKPSLAPYGYDSSGFGQELTFPGGERVIVDPGFAGSYYLNLLYLEDHFPGDAAVGSWGGYDWTQNDLKWARIGCVDPIEEPQILISPDSTAYPRFVPHGRCDTVTVEVLNDGNLPLHISLIDTNKYSPPGDWLAISCTTLDVSAGVNNTATFDIYLNHDGLVNNPGTVVALNGDVRIVSNAPPPHDETFFSIADFLVVDTVAPLKFDTLSTLRFESESDMNDFIRLVVSNYGELGWQGKGGVSLDFSQDGQECDPGANIYLYSGGPFILEGNDYDRRLTYASPRFGGLQNVQLFKPVLGHADPQHYSAGYIYESYFSGTFVNWDTTIGLEQTIYAPRGSGDSADFVVQRLQVFPLDDLWHGSLTVGQYMDWDIPSDDTARNVAFVDPDMNMICFQGTDTADDTLACQEDQSRYGGQSMLGWYRSNELQLDQCANNLDYYGSFAGAADTSGVFLWKPDLVASDLWNTIEGSSGLNILADDTDLCGIMTYVHNVDLEAGDTLTFYTVITVVRNGTPSDLRDNVKTARAWYGEHLRPGCTNLFGCCIGITGNVDGDFAELVDIGDLTALIAYLYIPPNPQPACYDEANIDGDEGNVVDIGDLTALIAYLYIPPNPEPSNCK
jgi:hypothetical protein